MTPKKLQSILDQHKRWLSDPATGKRANLRDADLRYANMSGAILRDAELRYANLREANLREANMSGAILREANLSGANLRDANLSGALLWGTVGNMREVKSLQLETYAITYTAEMLQIGCERHTIEDWFKFDDARIAAMDEGALEWWYKWRDTLKSIIEMSPAVPTGHKESGQ